MDSNKSRRKKSKEWSKNKRAFDEILGDPFSPDYIEGVYNILHQSSSISSIEGSFGEAPGTVYAGKPSILDFFCDVDMVIGKLIEDSSLRNRFYLTYIQLDLESPWALPRALSTKYEQLIGKELLVRGISPIKRYFTSTRERGR